MATYATADDVRPRLGNRPLTADSSPSITSVEGWLDELEAELLGTLEALGMSSSEVSTRGASIIQKWEATAAAGIYREAMAAAAGVGSNEDGRAEVKEWTDRLADMAARPSFYRQMLCGGAASGSTSLLGGPTSTRDPWFTTDEKW